MNTEDSWFFSVKLMRTNWDLIPVQFTADGNDISPPLEWECLPRENLKTVLQGEYTSE